MTVHPAANEASLRHLARRLYQAELELAVAVGNIDYKDVLIAERDAEIAERDAEIAELKKPTRKPRARTPAAPKKQG